MCVGSPLPPQGRHSQPEKLWVWGGGEVGREGAVVFRVNWAFDDSDKGRTAV